MNNEPRYHVFLSYHEQDERTARLIAERLRAEYSIQPWLRAWSSVPGRLIQEEQERGLAQSQACAVLIGAVGVRQWQQIEVYASIRKRIEEEGANFPVIPVYLPNCPANARRVIPSTLQLYEAVAFSAMDDKPALERLVAGIRGEAGLSAAITLPDEPAPYRGLLPFDQRHARFFFGRDADRQRLVERLAQHPFVAVVGASGSGKSSLAMAGLLTDLAQNAFPDSNHWRILLFTPGSQPLLALASQLATFLPMAERPHAVDDLATRLAARSDALRTTLLAYTADQPAPVLLVVDQFEELFTLCQEGPERCRSQAEQFIAQLDDATRRGDARIKILLTLRADFLDRCLAHAALRQLLEDHQLLLGPLDEAGLCEAIVRPAGEVGALFEKGLVEIILRDVAAEPGLLPLLQQAVYELWLRRRGPWLTLEAYQASGGVLGALQKRAEDTYQTLTTDQQDVARNVFLRLTALGEGMADTRRRVRREELYLAGRDPAQVDAVLQALSGPQARLIVADENTAEVTHEALIQQWGTLRTWLEQDRKSLHVHRRLTEAAAEWEQKERDESYLYQGARLAEATEWMTWHSGDLNPSEQVFLVSSLAMSERQEADREARRQAQRRRTRTLRALLTALAILLIPGLFVTGNAWMFWQRQNSQWQSTGFPSDSVLSIAVTGETEDQQVPRICVGAADIGIGCSRNLQEWNIYQVGFPAGAAEAFNDRGSFFGYLTGSKWSSRMVGVEVLAFDRFDPHRIVASVQGKGLFVSGDGGAHWRHLSSPDGPQLATKALPGVRQVASYNGDLFVLRNLSLSSGEDGSLYLSRDNGDTWQQIGGPGTATGVLNSFALALDTQGHLEGVYGAGEQGLYWREGDSGDQWQQLLPTEKGDTGIVVAQAADVVYLATYNQSVQRGVQPGALYRWTKGDSNRIGRRWAQFDGWPISLVLASNPNADYPIWMLLAHGRVFAVDRHGQLESRGRRPGWPWAFTNVLAAMPFDNGDDVMLMGQWDGLLCYRAQGSKSDGCGPTPSSTPQINR